MTTVTKLVLADSTGAPNANTLIRAPKVLSEANHRLYREHMTYTCRVNLSTDDNVSQMDIYALAPTWYVMNALRHAKRAHDAAMKEERSMVGQARWYDFRVEHDLPASTDGSPIGLDTGGNVVAMSTANSEYLASQIHDLAGNNKSFCLSQATSTSRFNVFTEYDNMGNVSDSPDTPAPGGYNDVYAGTNVDNMDDLLARGNKPPYNPDTWNVVWVKVGTLYRNSGGNESRSTGFFEAPLGTIWIPNASLAQIGNKIELEVKAGKYKGVQAVSL